MPGLCVSRPQLAVSPGAQLPHTPGLWGQLGAEDLRGSSSSGCSSPSWKSRRRSGSSGSAARAAGSSGGMRLSGQALPVTALPSLGLLLLGRERSTVPSSGMLWRGAALPPLPPRSPCPENRPSFSSPGLAGGIRCPGQRRRLRGKSRRVWHSCSGCADRSVPGLSHGLPPPPPAARGPRSEEGAGGVRAPS